MGRRTVVVTSGDGEAAPAVIAALVEAGVEVHVVAGEHGARSGGVASWNVCDLGSVEALDGALARIGAVIQHVFHCEPTPAAFAAVAEGARPLMPVGGSIVAVDAREAGVDEFVRAHAGDFAGGNIHLLCATAGGALHAGALGLA
ncbi:MAG TPA: hypothetical protein VGI86_04195 [Acidimicrobiia bacterium]